MFFDPSVYNERPGLLEFNGTIYTTWGSHCDQGAYTAWVMAYSADTLKQTAVLNLVPNGSDGGIWMSGAAPGLDASGNIYFIVGNGTFDTNLNASGFPPQHDCGNCFAKISPSAPLSLLDYFTPSNTVAQSDQDLDFGSGGPLLLPDLTDASGTTRHLAVGSGKDANIYVLDRDNMGKFNSGGDNIYQLIPGELSGGEFRQAILFQQYGLLRRHWRYAQGLPHHERQAGNHTGFTKPNQLWPIRARRQAFPPTETRTELSGRCGKRQYRSAARLRCH